jgi:hypothetical protein
MVKQSFLPMAIVKIDPNDVEFNRIRQVYRAIPQGFIKSDLFDSSGQSGRPSYMARTGMGGTYVSPDFFSGLGHGRDWAGPCGREF